MKQPLCPTYFLQLAVCFMSVTFHLLLSLHILPAVCQKPKPLGIDVPIMAQQGPLHHGRTDAWVRCPSRGISQVCVSCLCKEVVYIKSAVWALQGLVNPPTSVGDQSEHKSFCNYSFFTHSSGVSYSPYSSCLSPFFL